MKTMKLVAHGEEEEVYCAICRYADNLNLALTLYTVQGECYATITTNISPLPADTAAVDINNCPWAEDLIKKYHLGVEVDRKLRSGFVVYPVYKFDMTVLAEYADDSPYL